MTLEKNEVVVDALLEKLTQEWIIVEVTEEALADAMSCNSNSGGGCGRSGSCGASKCRSFAEEELL